MLCQFHLAGLKCCAEPLEQSLLRIKHFIIYVMGYQSQHGCKKEFNQTLDPSNFLWALRRKLSIIRGVPFDFNTQQDVAEILQAVLDELKGLSLASHLICNTQKSQFLVIPAFVPLSQIKIQMTSKLL